MYISLDDLLFLNQLRGFTQLLTPNDVQSLPISVTVTLVEKRTENLNLENVKTILFEINYSFIIVLKNFQSNDEIIHQLEGTKLHKFGKWTSWFERTLVDEHDYYEIANGIAKVHLFFRSEVDAVMAKILLSN